MKVNVIKINPCLVVCFNFVSTRELILSFEILVNQPLFIVGGSLTVVLVKRIVRATPNVEE